MIRHHCRVHLYKVLGKVLLVFLFVCVLAVGVSCTRHNDADHVSQPERVADVTPPVEATAELVSRRFGTLTGRVIYRGPLPGSTTMYISEAGDIEAHTIIVDAKTGGLKNSAVWVEGAETRMPIAEVKPATLDQRHWAFVPHVLTLRVGQEVAFLNSDLANHNVHAENMGYQFNFATPTGGDLTRRFDRPTNGQPVRIACDVHTWMLAWLYVFDHDAFATTDASGQFRIDNIAAGSQVLHVHHADGNLAARLEVDVAPDAVTDVTIEARKPDSTPSGALNARH
ncbi:MAG: carboxypeptidase regulatory-like domain-containing protein [Planctomycetes bacterium]|nr:carboxypeptidase regulatory-like domain-containing protein [Planctomycetota bacterium]